MDILKDIENLIEDIKSKPQSLDLDSIKDTLIASREIVIDGLQRSQDAQLFKSAEKEIQNKSSIIKSQETLLDSMKSKVSELESNSECLESLYAHLKNRAVGIARLTYKEQLLETTISDLNACKDVSKFLALQARIENDFENSIGNQPPESISLKNKKVLKTSNFLIGGN